MLLPEIQLQQLSVFTRVLQTQLTELPSNPFLHRTGSGSIGSLD